MAVARYSCYPSASPIHWNLESLSVPIRLDASNSWIEGSLASHAETARLGLVECSLATWSQRWTGGVWHRSHRLHHTPYCTSVPRSVRSAACGWTRYQTCWGLTSATLTCWSDLERYSRVQRRSSCHTQETEKWCHIPLGCATESVRWTLTDKDLREWSELTGMSQDFFPIPKPTGASIQQCRCPPYKHMPYCGLAPLHQSDAGVSGCPPQLGGMVEVPIRQSSCCWAHRRCRYLEGVFRLCRSCISACW